MVGGELGDDRKSLAVFVMVVYAAQLYAGHDTVSLADLDGVLGARRENWAIAAHFDRPSSAARYWEPPVGMLMSPAPGSNHPIPWRQWSIGAID